MGAVYADRAGHFGVIFRSKERRDADEEEALTLIKRALTALDMKFIIALNDCRRSPPCSAGHEVSRVASSFVAE